MRKIVPTLIICFIAGLVASTSMLAAESASGKSSENKISYKGNNRRQIEVPSNLLVGKLNERDLSLAISVKSVLEKLKAKQDLVLIDVRNEKEFAKTRIPGSINIPLSAIKTKVFLKDKNLILFNEGYSYSKLEQECKRLKGSGFAFVLILNGGLNYWKEYGGALEGDVFKQKELNKILPRAFFAERNYKNRVIIDVSRERAAETTNLILQVVHIPYTDKSKEFSAKIKAAIDKHKNDTLVSILIFNKNGQDYEKIEKLLQKTGVKTSFYLKGGLEGYKTFIHEQVLMWQAKDKSRKTTKECGSCS